ncbi:glycosyltransferase family 2 protein [Hyphococcus flavus]|uniref:Glycosyltransferase family 2 protein n=1 Tax=Hyphococcus flavus TaxID=1866326 RepID=A0AAE9ZE90_9PROT|nr:glycosyltransferase family 2 protein [Hyphococcus flavus]WDI32105.1 glycosyltransferase family 2 protein [Hyphococcus flavus]
MQNPGFKKNQPYRLGVIIVNYQTPELVETCLSTLAPQLGAVNGCCVIVDNASGDGSLDRLTAWCEVSPAADRLMVVSAPQNGGFSAGNNIGLKHLNADLVLLLNSDAAVKPDALIALIRAADHNSQASIFTPLIVDGDGEPQVSRFRRHRLLSEFVDGAQTGPITKVFPKAETPIFPEDIDTEPDWVSFSAVMIRRQAIEDAGPMDEGFFLYYEDCDYCRRLTGKGHRICYVPDAVFQHDAGGSTKLRERQAKSARLPEYYYRSRSRYFRKTYGPLGPIAANLFWFAGRGVALARGIVGRPAPKLSANRYADMWIGWRGDNKS